ncbi:hypothetical protein DNAM5_13 [Haloarcula californiae tailed virus 1]|uniref:Uncharacterized protein n=1 Tax=Haloarcula californiae tailed virus 1 TaxID=1273746 RepID=R4THT7_9CAUD|nr:hypothetical protein M202_gp013 [Haloarcula californiae tailed virus 1]AGM11876.1 hypothetical protein DNAM5_13 [Haloarcula californiae tailed virus 1]
MLGETDERGRAPVNCPECGAVKMLPFGLADDLGGVDTCAVCERGLMPESALNNDEAPVEDPSTYV